MRGSAGPPPCPSRQSAQTTDTLGHDPAHKETEIDYSRPEWIWLSRLFKSCQACQCRSQSRPESMLSETSAASSVMCSHHIQHTFSPSVLPGFTEKKKKSRVTFVSEILYVFLCTDLLVLLFYWHLEIAEKLKLWLAPLKNLSDTTACSEMTEKNP